MSRTRVGSLVVVSTLCTARVRLLIEFVLVCVRHHWTLNLVDYDTGRAIVFHISVFMLHSLKSMLRVLGIGG